MEYRVIAKGANHEIVQKAWGAKHAEWMAEQYRRAGYLVSITAATL